MSNWPLRKISDVAEFLNSKRIPLKSLDRQKRQGVYPYYGASGIVDYIDDYIFDGTYLLISEDGENLRTRNTPIAFKATGKFWVNNHAHILAEKEEGILDYLEYYFSTLDLTPYITGAVQPKLNKANLDSIEIPVPEKEERLAINRVLNSMTNKIQLNRQTNQTLEQIAQAIFKSWFVDFDPVRAKVAAREAFIQQHPEVTEEAIRAAAGTEGDTLAHAGAKACELAAMCAISGKSEEQLDEMDVDTLKQLKTTAALFPDEMVESELGEVPEGWVVKAFGDLLSKTIGGDWGKDEPDEKHTEKVKILRGTDLPKVYVGEDGAVPIRFVEAKKLATRKLQAGDIVIEVSGGSKNQPTGRSLYLTDGILNRLGATLEPASFCRLFRPIDREHGLMLGLHLQKIYEDGKTWQYQNQSTGISNFQTKVFLEKEKVVVPSKDVLVKFYEMTIPFLQKIASSESNGLVAIRDYLLPKLLSGEVELAQR